MSYTARKTQAIINLNALKSNYQFIDSLATNSATIAVIKADAYGHGSVDIAISLDELVPAFAVAFIDEAVILRNAGVKSPILILEGSLSEEDFTFALQHNFWLMLHNHEQVTHLQNLNKTYNGKLWLKIDTGMHRLGFMPSEVSEIIVKVQSCLQDKQKKELVLCSHFSSSEETNNAKTLKQIQYFDQLSAPYNYQASLANSAAIIQWPQSHRHFNRLGLALYGINPISKINSQDEITSNLVPVMTLQSSIIGLKTIEKGDSVGYGEKWQAKRTSVIAIVAIGYADGYPQNAKAGTPVLINNQLAPLAGKVSMDMISVDVTELNDVRLGDLVELWGENLPVETVATYLETSSYELLTRVSTRLPRKYN